jgi:hypothetical protein
MRDQKIKPIGRWVGLRLKLDFFDNLVKPEPEPDISTI